MARSIKGFRPRDLDLRRRFYTDDDIDRIIGAAGALPASPVVRILEDGAGNLKEELTSRRVALADGLEQAAHAYVVDAEFQKKPTHQQLKSAFVRIEDAAEELLNALQIPPGGDFDSMPDSIRFGGLQAYAALDAEKLGGPPNCTGERMLRQACEGIHLLKRWAQAAKVRNAIRPGTSREMRHQGDQALDAFFERLAFIWMDLWGQVIQTSVGGPGSANRGHAQGPVVRFFRECLTPVLNKTPSNDAIRRRIERLDPLVHGRFLSVSPGKSDPGIS